MPRVNPQVEEIRLKHCDACNRSEADMVDGELRPIERAEEGLDICAVCAVPDLRRQLAEARRVARVFYRVFADDDDGTLEELEFAGRTLATWEDE